jgi:hypothetical protein
MLQVYMKACSTSRNELFKNTEEIMDAVAKARSRLHNRFRAGGKALIGRYAWIVLFGLLLFIGTTVMVNYLFYSFFRIVTICRWRFPQDKPS